MTQKTDIKKILVRCSQESFGYAFSTKPTKTHNMAFVHAKDYATGLQQLKEQLSEIFGGTWDLADDQSDYCGCIPNGTNGAFLAVPLIKSQEVA